MIRKTITLDSSSILNLSTTPYELLPGLVDNNDYYIFDKVVFRLLSGSIAYNIPTSSYLQIKTFEDVYFTLPPSLLNDNKNDTNLRTNNFIFSGSLFLNITGSDATTGSATLALDIFYEKREITDNNVSYVFSGSQTRVDSFTRGVSNQALADFSSAEGFNTTAGTKYSISTTIVSGSISPSAPSYVDVPGLPQVGSRILLDDTNYSNIYGKIILDVDSTVQQAGPPEITTIYLTNPSIQTPTASIYFLDYPRSGDSISGSYSHTEGSNTNAFGEYSHAEGDSTIAIGNSSHASGIGTIAFGTGQTVTGKYNLFNNTDLFIIGNGTDNATRSNIVAISDTSVSITGSLNVSTDINANLTGTASWATNAVTATTALTASHAPSYVLTSNTSSMSVLSSSFALTASYTLSSPGGTGDTTAIEAQLWFLL